MAFVTVEEIEYLIEMSKKIEMDNRQVTEQRRSFAYGNSAFENPHITRQMIDEVAREIGL